MESLLLLLVHFACIFCTLHSITRHFWHGSSRCHQTSQCWKKINENDVLIRYLSRVWIRSSFFAILQILHMFEWHLFGMRYNANVSTILSEVSIFRFIFKFNTQMTLEIANIANVQSRTTEMRVLFFVVVVVLRSATPSELVKMYIFMLNSQTDAHMWAWINVLYVIWVLIVEQCYLVVIRCFLVCSPRNCMYMNCEF